MNIQDEILKIVNEENQCQCGLFLNIDKDEYFEKLSSKAELLVHLGTKEVLGFVYFYCNAPDKNSSYISLIATQKAARSQGIGSGLLDYVLAISRNRNFSYCSLEVSKSNISAQRFYKKKGFEIIEEREERFLMRLLIK